MDNVNSMLDGEMDRRTFVATTAGIGISSLAGCGGDSNQKPQDGNNGSTKETGTNDDQPASTDTQQREYPAKEPQSGAEQQLVGGSKGDVEGYAIKFDDFQYVNMEGLDSMGQGRRTYEEALVAATSDEIMSRIGSDYEEDADSIWFSFVNDAAVISMIPNAEDQENKIVAGVFGYANPDKPVDSQSLSESEIESEHAEFISERLDGDGVVNHGGEIPDYARGALESGWQA